MKHSVFARSLVVVISMLLVSCGGGQTTPSPKETAILPGPSPIQPVTTTTAALATVEIAIKGFAFDPASVTAKVGTSITWTNQDSVAHTITSDKGDWDSGKTAQNGKYIHVFDQVGTYTYHCSVHPSMKGTIVVTP